MDKKLNNELEGLKKELMKLKNKSPLNENAIRSQLYNVGVKCYELGKYDEALRYFNECLEIEKRILPSNHSDIADTLYYIGIVNDNQRKYEEALKYYNQSLEIYKQTLPSNHFSIAATLNNIGEVYGKQRKYEEALKYFNQSLEIYKQTLPSYHSSIADTLNNIGIVYRNQGKYEEALKYYNQSLEIYKQTLPSNHPSIANILNNIGEVYRKQGKYEEALKYLNQSLEMKKQTLPSDHPSIAGTLNNIGLLYKDQGKYEIAINYFTDEKLKDKCRQKLREQQQKNSETSNGNLLKNIFRIGSSKNSKKEQDDIEYKNKIQEANESLNRERKERERLEKEMEKMKLENELREKREKRLKEELEKERENKLNEQKIKEEQNKRNISTLLKTLPVREVESDIISTIWITSDENSNELIGKVINRKYKIDEYLGQGGFGKVYTILDLNENNTKVIKLIKLNDEEWKKEASLLSRLIHENLVKYYDHFQLTSKESLFHPCIITEYCQNGDLSKRIKETKNRKETFPDKVILNWIFQATKGLLYLHSMSVIHRDIKPENILLSGENVVKLADLGGAKVIRQSILGHSKHFGSFFYMSPEMLNFDDYSFPTDIWSLGCVLYELAFLQLAHRNRGKEHPSGGSQLFSATIKRMLVDEPSDRIMTQNLYDDLEKLKHVLGI